MDVSSTLDVADGMPTHLTSGGRLLVDCLKTQGVDTIFGVPGESYLEVLDALYDAPGIRFIGCRHEGAAANMAEADGKLTGRPGICMVTRGPGATHAAIGVHTAAQDSTPMILIIGQAPRGHRGREAWQEIDYDKMFGSVAKWSAEIQDPERIPEYIARAFTVATSGRPGPVVLSFPEDVLSAKCASPEASSAITRSHGVGAAPSAEAIDSLAAELTAARQPLVILGGSNWSAADCALLQDFAAAWDLPVAASFRRQDLFDNRLANYVGHAGLSINPKLAARIQNADLIVAVGCRLSETTTGGYALLSAPRSKQRLIHIHADSQELGKVYQSDLAINTSPHNLMAALRTLQAPNAVPWSQWRETARREYEVFSSAPEPTNPGTGDMAQVVAFLSKTLPPDSILSNGAGNYTVWLHRFFHFRERGTQLAPVSGAMGYGLPAAIAAKCRFPGKTVVCFAGDGCFLMYPQELSTAVQADAAVIVLVVDNGLYGTIRMHQERTFPGRPIATDIAPTDFVALAKSFGAYAERVETTEAFPQAFARAADAKRAAVLWLRVDPLQITPTARLPQAAHA